MPLNGQIVAARAGSTRQLGSLLKTRKGKPISGIDDRHLDVLHNRRLRLRTTPIYQIDDQQTITSWLIDDDLQTAISRKDIPAGGRPVRLKIWPAARGRRVDGNRFLEAVQLARTDNRHIRRGHVLAHLHLRRSGTTVHLIGDQQFVSTGLVDQGRQACRSALDAAVGRAPLEGQRLVIAAGLALQG